MAETREDRPPSSEQRPPGIARGSRLGRYLVLEELGSGGMGTVWAAWDDRLERRVALKLRRASAARDDERLLSEARAAARLDHPHVVRVHDAGVIAGEVFVAFELIKGTTLRKWLRASRSSDAILRAFLQAGHGLAAAHRAGLVHRDFKPENVLVDETGRVAVTDFGLARPLEHSTDAGAPGAAPSLRTASARFGTPAYMAPEQVEGGTLDARTDQFSFCVALSEALDGVHPFVGASGTTDTGTDVDATLGRPRTASTGPRRAPTRVAAAVARGLSTAPSDRWPSMEALLAVLERAVEAPRRRKRWAVLAGAVLIVSASVAFGAYSFTASVRQCAGASARRAPVWNPARRAAVEDAIRGTKAVWAEAMAAVTIRLLDDRVGQWEGAAREACEATRVRGEASEAALDLRMACLQRRLDELDALVGLLGSADGALAARAYLAVDQLPTVAVCADVESLLGVVPLPADPAVRAKVGSVRTELGATLALAAAGQFKEAAPRVERAVADAKALGWAPLEADALAQQFNLAFELGLPKPEVMGEAALLAAERGRDWSKAIDVRLDLAFAARSAAQYPEALRHARHAEALLDTRPDAVRTVRLEAYRALILMGSGAAREALEHADRAVGLAEGLRPADPLRLASALNTRGMVHSTLGSVAGAVADFARAAQLRVEQVGPSHPDAVVASYNAAASLVEQGDYVTCERQLRALLPRARGVFDPPHRRLAMMQAQYGRVLLALGRDAEAKAEGLAALQMRRALNPTHPDVARSLLGVAEAELALGQHDAALAHAREAEQLVAAQPGEVALAAGTQARALLAAGSPKEARAIAERAVGLARTAGLDDARQAGVDLVFAQAGYALGLRRDAVAQAKEARARLAARPEFARGVREADAWLATHPPD